MTQAIFSLSTKSFEIFFGIVHLDEAAEPLGQNLRSLYSIVYQFDRLGYFRYQFKFAGLDLGHVQQFARDRKQAVAALLMLVTSCFCFRRSAFPAGRRRAAAKLIRIDEIGVSFRARRSR